MRVALIGVLGLLCGSVVSMPVAAEPPAAPASSEAEPEGDRAKEDEGERPSEGSPNVHVFDPVEVVDTPISPFRADEPTSASRIRLDVMDVPKAVQVVPEAVIADQQAILPNEVTRNVSSVQQGGGFAPGDDAFIIRGFLQSTTYKDGIRGTQIGSSLADQPASTDLANIDRVEVVKGPESILFGRVQPGGIVNYVTRVPLFQPAYSLTQRFGSYDFYRTELDLTGPITDDLAYRLIGVYQTSGGFTDFTESERGFGSGGLLWRPNTRTQVRLRFDFQYDDGLDSPGLPLVDGQLLAGVPYDRFLGEPTVNGRTSKVFEAFFEADHRLSDSLELSLRAAYQPTWITTHDVDLGNYAQPFMPYYDPETQTLARTLFDTDVDESQTTIQAWAKGAYPVPTLGVDWLDGLRGKLVGGLEWDQLHGDGTRFIADFSRINPFDPVYTGYQIDPFLQFLQTFSGTVDDFSLVAENDLTWRDQVHLLAGVRASYVEVHIDNTNSQFLPSSSTDQYASPVVPFAGLLARPIEPLSFFFSYSESFEPTRFALSTASGEPLEPETGQQLEGGLKWEPFENRLLATATVFEIERQNVISPDPSDPAFWLNIGEERSRGVEIDVAGELRPEWNVIASYAYIDAHITEDANGMQGNRLAGVPYNSGSVWTSYQLLDGGLRGLGAGIGVFFADRIENDSENSAELPSRVELDAALFYVASPIEVRLNFKNLTDQEAYQASDLIYRTVPVPPLTVLGSLAVHF